MKKVILLSVVALLTILSSCNSKKTVSESNKSLSSQILTPCPENVECNLDILRNKSLVVKHDDTGAIYYELENNSEKTVYLYTYKLKTDKEYQDAGYREEIIFEIYDSNADFVLTNKELQTTKMLFGVWCYCKGKAGNYKITKGNFHKKGNEIKIDFPAIVKDQKVTELEIKL